MQILEKNKLYANFKKCDFQKEEVAYLGYIISSHGVVMDQSKVHAMLAWPTPKTLRDLRGFLGF